MITKRLFIRSIFHLSPWNQQEVIENITDEEIKFIVEDMYLGW